MTSSSEEDLLNCAICLEPYSDPKTLPCLHTFCFKCLHDYHRSSCCLRSTASKNIIFCPTCRETFALPTGGVKGFPSDFRMPKVAEVLRKSAGERGNDSTDECFVCMQLGVFSRAVYFCTDCGLKFCPSCTDRHNGMALFSHHQTLAVPTLESTVPCSEHPRHFARYYCCSCSHLVCSACILTVHREHALTECQQLKKNQLQTLISPLERKLSNAENAIAKLECYLDKSETLAAASETEILSLKTEMISQIQDQACCLLAQLAESRTQKVLLVESELKKYKRCLQKWRDAYAMGQGLLQQSDKEGLYPGQCQVIRELELAVNEPFPKYSRDVKQTLQFFSKVDSVTFGRLEPVLLKVEEPPETGKENDTTSTPGHRRSHDNEHPAEKPAKSRHLGVLSKLGLSLGQGRRKKALIQRKEGIYWYLVSHSLLA